MEHNGNGLHDESHDELQYLNLAKNIIANG